MHADVEAAYQRLLADPERYFREAHERNLAVVRLAERKRALITVAEEATWD